MDEKQQPVEPVQDEPFSYVNETLEEDRKLTELEVGIGAAMGVTHGLAGDE